MLLKQLKITVEWAFCTHNSVFLNIELQTTSTIEMAYIQFLIFVDINC